MTAIPPVRFRLPFKVLALIALATVSACSQAPGGKAPRPAMIQPIGNAQQLGDVVDLLDKGKEGAARKKLQQMIKRDPSDSTARRLLDSMTADPVALLGARNFEYRVQPGDRLMDLAQHYLGDRLKFYALARYNGIEIPASVRSGQVLRIPGEAPQRPTPRPAHSEPARPAASAPAPGPAPAPAPARPTAPAAADPARAARLRGAGLAALNQGQVAKAVILLHQAAALDPGNALIQRDLQRAQRIRRTVKEKR